MKIMISGISSAVGKILTPTLKEKGYEVFGTYHKNPVDFFDVDVFDSVEELLKKKTPNALINTIGITINGMVENISVSDFKEVLDINLVSYFRTIKECLPKMKETGGKIINISSIVTKTHPMGCMPYIISKSAINSMTICMAKELARHNILINAINLGYMNFGMGEKLPGEIKEKVTNQIPLKRFGDPKALIDCVLYLLGAEYVTGSILEVGGGL